MSDEHRSVVCPTCGGRIGRTANGIWICMDNYCPALTDQQLDDRLSTPNRWITFTDDELATALAEIGDSPDWRRGGSGFREEITAEIERRKTGAT